MGKSMSVAKNGRNLRNVVPEKVKIDPEISLKNNRRAQAIAMARAGPTSEYLENENKIDANFNEKLKSVFVSSQHSNPDLSRTSSRPLPSDRTGHMVPSQSLEPTERVPDMLTVEELHAILLRSYNEGEDFSIHEVSNEYNVQPELLDKFLQYYKPFDVFVPLANDKTRDTTIRGKKLPLEDQSNRITSHTTEEETMRIMKARPKKPPPGYEY